MRNKENKKTNLLYLHTSRFDLLNFHIFVWSDYQEWFINLARLPFLVASIDSDALRQIINASLRPTKQTRVLQEPQNQIPVKYKHWINWHLTLIFISLGSTFGFFPWYYFSTVFNDKLSCLYEINKLKYGTTELKEWLNN